MGADGEMVDRELESFVDRNVPTLVAWEILLFFDAHRDAVLDRSGLARRLGRRDADIDADIDALCRTGVLECSGGLVRFAGDPATATGLDRFVEAVGDPRARKVIIGRVMAHLDEAARAGRPAS